MAISLVVPITAVGDPIIYQDTDFIVVFKVDDCNNANYWIEFWLEDEETLYAEFQAVGMCTKDNSGNGYMFAVCKISNVGTYEIWISDRTVTNDPDQTYGGDVKIKSRTTKRPAGGTPSAARKKPMKGAKRKSKK